MRALGGQALQLDGEAPDVDAVAHRVSLVGGVRGDAAYVLAVLAAVYLTYAMLRPEKF